MDFLNKKIMLSLIIPLLLIGGCNNDNHLSHDSFLNKKEANFDGAKMYVLHQRQISQLETIIEKQSFISLGNDINVMNALIDTPLVDINPAQVQQLQTIMQGYQYTQPDWNAVVKETLLSLTTSDNDSGQALRVKYQLKQHIIKNSTFISNAINMQRQRIAYAAFVKLARKVDVDSDGNFDLPILNHQDDRILAIVDMTQVKNARYQAIVFEANESNINIKDFNANNTQQINKTVQEIVTQLALKI
ncbi:hypothetical protein [Photobacterium kishitanii]|uniref:hypothetical protein n=2 Tax=Photobacterium kishitanii TaxID=318456 RepID=UPI000D168108|nr:hypothetical protein [Photobacterium kishitanii]PSW47264.1 hypothetical protein C0W66_18950 [Photobacterium kishitanii]